MFNELADFYIKSHPVTLGVLALLALYFIILNWIYFYRYFTLGAWLKSELSALESLMMGSTEISSQSFLYNFTKNSTNKNRELFMLGLLAATKDATKGLSTLSIFASTTPFIGLFGTVVSILDTFTHIGQSGTSMSHIATGVSDALVATAAGIFVAIFAYTYHQVLKRKSYEIINLLEMQRDAIIARGA
ncbi:MAG: MotA/TolQ/ExbB proton channel family protein [Sulfuricurvum sp.]